MSGHTLVRSRSNVAIVTRALGVSVFAETMNYSTRVKSPTSVSFVRKDSEKRQCVMFMRKFTRVKSLTNADIVTRASGVGLHAANMKEDTVTRSITAHSALRGFLPG